MFLLMGAMLALGAWNLARKTRNLSSEGLRVLLPSLDLTDSQRAYAETIVALGRSGRSKAEVEETTTALNALLDEETRLEGHRERAAGQEAGDALARLESERDALRVKADATTDTGARDAYAQSLVLLEERIAGLRADDGTLERIDAHLALLRQAILATRDAARRLDSAPTLSAPDLATDSLRSAVALARAQTTETERALAELRAI